MTIAKTTNGNIFGGLSWSCYGYQTDYSASLFSLVNPQNVNPYKIMISNPEYAIFRSPYYGPTFGRGHDLY